MTNPSDIARIRELNDKLRRTLSPEHGRIMLTAGIDALPPATVQRIFEHIRTFDDFSADNDPYAEHDFGRIKIGDHNVFWKIDCYDRELSGGSDDPSDAEQTVRVLTVMLAEEY